jgi:hypothetical protein
MSLRVNVGIQTIVYIFKESCSVKKTGRLVFGTIYGHFKEATSSVAVTTCLVAAPNWTSKMTGGGGGL